MPPIHIKHKPISCRDWFSVRFNCNRSNINWRYAWLKVYTDIDKIKRRFKQNKTNSTLYKFHAYLCVIELKTICTKLDKRVCFHHRPFLANFTSSSSSLPIFDAINPSGSYFLSFQLHASKSFYLLSTAHSSSLTNNPYILSQSHRTHIIHLKSSYLICIFLFTNWNGFCHGSFVHQCSYHVANERWLADVCLCAPVKNMHAFNCAKCQPDVS